MSIQEVFAIIHGNLGSHELSYISLHPKKNCPEQIFCKHGKRKHAYLLITVLLQLEALSGNESKFFLARFDQISIVDFIFLGFIFIFLLVFSKIRIENGIFIQIVAPHERGQDAWYQTSLTSSVSQRDE